MKDYVPLAQQVEAYGFAQMHIADDLVFRPAWPILTMIAMNTSRLQIGPFIKWKIPFSEMPRFGPMSRKGRHTDPDKKIFGPPLFP